MPYPVRNQVRGLAPYSQDEAQAYWLENLQYDDNGVWRPRWGLKWVYGFASAITHLSRGPGYTHNLMIVANGGQLYHVDVETPGVPGAIDTGWPSTPLVNCVSGSYWVACKSAIGGAVGPVKLYDGTTLSDPTTPPSDGNYIGTHGAIIMRAKSGDTSTQALRWTTVGDPNVWTSTFAKSPLPELGTVDAVVPFTSRETLLFGPQGIGHVIGNSPQSGLVFEPLISMAITTPMRHLVKCRDRVIFAGAGPALYQYVPPNNVQRIDPPIHRNLYSIFGTNNFRSWYDALRNCYVLWDNFNERGYLYDLDQNRWISALSFGTAGVNLLGQAVIDQGASMTDAATQPWAKGFIGASHRLLQWDPSIYTDFSASGSSSGCTCVVEYRPVSSGEVERQLQEVWIEAQGVWTVVLKYRQLLDGAWSTVSLGTVDTGTSGFAKVYPSLANMPVYRDRVIQIQATSASNVRFRAMAVKEITVGEKA